MRHGRVPTSVTAQTHPQYAQHDPFADEPATELMEMPIGAPVSLVELGADDLEPWDDAPSRNRAAPLRPPRGPAPGVPSSGAARMATPSPMPRRSSQVITAPIPDLFPEPEAAVPQPVAVPRPLPVLFGGRGTPSRPFPVVRGAAVRPPSRQRWVASAVALATAWGVLLLLGVCVALAMLARAAV